MKQTDLEESVLWSITALASLWKANGSHSLNYTVNTILCYETVTVHLQQKYERAFSKNNTHQLFTAELLPTSRLSLGNWGWQSTEYIILVILSLVFCQPLMTG